MRTHLRVTAAALVFIGLATGCARTTEGSVAMTTEPGPPISAPTRTPSTDDPDFPGIPGLPNIPGLPQIPGFPMPGNTNVPEVPAPANSETMQCSEFTKLDEATQRAVIKAILEKQDPQQGEGPESEMVAAIMASAMCSFLPSAVVKEVVLGGSPP
ncbi:hypothetical protein [Mycobacterium sp. ITM-2016-00318]|uniref:hypothetical protein n=1 Tax=Mycobacterium sp. ITM-2016-00318 TaxID=2099693 RepID=UPI000CF97E53|nr:hypothetical protein [Mycobacterium sp. ITM-2016-00318]WNG92656.1 hypothetical protein C6A82_025320 [Mycobacterium sp. ITM-2016-00318]